MNLIQCRPSIITAISLFSFYHYQVDNLIIYSSAKSGSIIMVTNNNYYCYNNNWAQLIISSIDWTLVFWKWTIVIPKVTITIIITKSQIIAATKLVFYGAKLSVVKLSLYNSDLIIFKFTDYFSFKRFLWKFPELLNTEWVLYTKMI